MPTMEPEPIQAEPTTESEPPDVTSLTTGTSQASASPAAGRGRGRKLRGVVIGLALVVAFCVGIGVFKDSPAEKAGVKEGDEIVSVDGNSTAGRTLDEVSGWVRGEAGSKVNVTVRPGPDGKTRDLSIVRADVAVVPVTWALVP